MYKRCVLFFGKSVRQHLDSCNEEACLVHQSINQMKDWSLELIKYSFTPKSDPRWETDRRLQAFDQADRVVIAIWEQKADLLTPKNIRANASFYFRGQKTPAYALNCGAVIGGDVFDNGSVTRVSQWRSTT